MMNLEDVGKILAVAAGHDRRTVGKTDLLTWGRALDGQDPRECAEAVDAHYRDPDTCGTYLTVGHVIGRIRAKRRADAARAQSHRVIADIERAKAESRTAAAEKARLECRAKFAAVAAQHAESVSS